MPVLSYGEVRIKHSKKRGMYSGDISTGVGFESLPLAYSGKGHFHRVGASIRGAEGSKGSKISLGLFPVARASPISAPSTDTGSQHHRAGSTS